MKVVEPGIYQMSDAAYQADCCEEISLRSSIAWKLIEKGGTPAAAAYASPRLNQEWVRETARHFDLGKAAHATLFGKGASIALIDGYDYATNEPRNGLKRDEKKERRDVAYEAGQIPLLIPEVLQVKAMTAAAKRQIDALVTAGTIDADPFTQMETEQVLVARVHGVLCRVMMDGLSLDGDVLSEYKTEGVSAAPDIWMWKARKLGYIFRLAFYRKVMEELKIAFSPRIHLFVQETAPPYLLAFYRVEDEFIAQEDDRVRKALKIWRRCLETNHWPGYSTAGFNLGLTEREEMASQAPKTGDPHSAHIPSEHVPDAGYETVGSMLQKKRKT